MTLAGTPHDDALSTGGAGSLTATECGRTCAVAGRSQREMRDWAAAYPQLYDAKAFDPALYSTLALAAAFSGPGLDHTQLRMANRACLWCFGLDWLVDFAATSPSEVAAIVDRCLAVADGGPAVPGDDLTRFLADIRTELAALPAFGALGEVWRDELERMLRAMALEWEWKTTRAEGTSAPPTFAAYLENADNLGFCFVFTTHWIATQGPVPATDIPAVREASRQVQQVIRLLNDLGTYERDLEWGDLNGLMLGEDRAAVESRIRELTHRFRELAAPLRGGLPELAGYLERQMDFCAGFYQITDFWGTL